MRSPLNRINAAFASYASATSFKGTKPQLSTDKKEVKKMADVLPGILSKKLLESLQRPPLPLKSPSDSNDKAKTLAILSQWYESPLIRMSPRKLHLVSRQLIDLQLENAINQMRFSDKRAANDVYLPLLEQALSNIKKHNLKAKIRKDIVIKQVVVCRGKYLKRIDIKARGRHGIIKKGSGFVRILLGLSSPISQKKLLTHMKKLVLRDEKYVWPRMDY